MSSTNVHSQETDNIYCAVAQMIPTEKEVEIPPKTAKKGPSSLDIQIGEGIEIPVFISELHKNGELTTKDGATIVKFEKEAFTNIAEKYKKQNRKVIANSTRKQKQVEDR